jgi:hypothetical protein
LGNIGTVCTVFKYISLQKRYPKLLIKSGTDFEVGQKRKTVPFHFTFGMNNLEMIPNNHKEKHFPTTPSLGIICYNDTKLPLVLQ